MFGAALFRKSAPRRSLLHGQDEEAYGEVGYQGVDKRPDANADVTWYIAMRPGKRKALDKNDPCDAQTDRKEKAKAGIRAKVKHPLRVIKRQFCYVKTRYRGLKKNTAQLVTVFALSNLWMVRGKLPKLLDIQAAIPSGENLWLATTRRGELELIRPSLDVLLSSLLWTGPRTHAAGNDLVEHGGDGGENDVGLDL